MVEETASPSPTRILLVEDSHTDAQLVQGHLKRSEQAFVVVRHTTLAAGLEQLTRGDIDVVLLDLNLPDSRGLDTFRALHRHALGIPIVVLSGEDDLGLALEAVKLGAQDYLTKGEFNRSSLTRSVRYAIERARRQDAEQELSAAGEIQRRLLPQRPPSIDGFDLHGRCEPAHLAGGDYFDYFPMPNHQWAIVVADVAGHGIGPALIMSETRAILRTLARVHTDPGEILTHANQVLGEDLLQETFIALMLICLNPIRGEITFASAGLPALMLDAHGFVEQRVESSDPPLAALDHHPYQSLGPLPFEPGGAILLFTDGIVEAANEQEEQFGETRMLEVIRENSPLTSREAINRLFLSVERFASEYAYHDDRTALLIKANPVGRGPRRGPQELRPR